MNVTSKIRADLTRPGVAEHVYAVQNDRLTHLVELDLYAAGTAWEIPTGVLVSIRYAKPDGTGGDYSTGDDGSIAYWLGTSSITISLVEQMLTVPGIVPVEVNLYTGNGQNAQKLTTFRFLLHVTASVVTDAEIVSSDYYNVFTAEAAQVASYANMVKAAYGAPRVAHTAAELQAGDHSLIYVYTGNETGYTSGNWYYWDGSAWASGGVYNSEAVTTDTTLTQSGVPADAKAAGDGIRSLDGLVGAISGIDIGTLTSGKYINRTTGAEGNDSNSSASGFIAVSPGMTVFITGVYTAGVRGVALYDANQAYKSTPSPQASLTDVEFVVPTGAAYMRLTAYKTTVPAAVYAELPALIETKLPANLGAANKQKYLAIDNSGAIVPAEPYHGSVGSSNPIDLNAIKVNGWVRCAANSKTYLTNAPTGTSGVLTIYTTIKAGGGDTQAMQYVIDQQMSVWARLLNLSTSSGITDWKKIIDGSGAQPYQKSRWYGKTIKCFGDSRTWYNGHEYNDRTKSEWTGRTCIGYQVTLAELTGATVTSDGHSGATSATICGYIRSANLTGIDAVLLEGGVNDYIKSSEVTIGQLEPIGSTFDTTTVYGAWQSAVEYILTNYPACKIFMTIPAIAWDANGVFPYSTAKIKGDVAELYNIPCLDLYTKGGINVVNRDYYYVDDVSETNWRLHFNDYGNALIGAEMAGFINTH